ncbi:DUF1254 domain-containing protein [Oerskovia sp. M15]
MVRLGDRHGAPGRDRGAGGRYLIVGPGYDGPLPDDGYFVAHCRTTRAWWFARAFKVDNDPAPAAEVIRNGLKIYPYQPGGVGSPVASYLFGAGPFGPAAEPAPTRFVDAVHKSFNTIPPVDDSYWDLINDVVQTEPVEAGNPEILGLLASVGIVKESRSPRTRGCARSSATRSRWVMRPPAPWHSTRANKKAGPPTPARPGSP